MLGLFFVVLSMRVYTTNHCQTSGRVVQELNVCIVCDLLRIYNCRITTWWMLISQEAGGSIITR